MKKEPKATFIFKAGNETVLVKETPLIFPADSPGRSDKRKSDPEAKRDGTDKDAA